MTRSTPRRLILFAGYSASGAVPLCDLNLLAELSRFGDVHAFYDNDALKAESIDRVRQIARSVTVERHREYDFGSWKRLILAAESTLDRFDELVLVNDSILLLQNLEPFFAALTDSEAVFFSPIFLDEHYPGPELLIEDYLHRNPFEQHSSMFTSYFWSMRKDIFRHYTFRDFVASIGAQPSRLDTSHRYERGFSRTVFRHLFAYRTTVDRVYPYSFVYTEQAFLLAAQGFPVIKKKAIVPEFYPIRHLRERVKMLQRVASDEFAAGLRDFVDRQAVPRQTRAVRAK